MANPIWYTAIDLGTYNNKTVIKIPLVAYPVSPAIGVTYQLVSGEVPMGTTLTSNGILSGELITLYTNNKLYFTVNAIDNLGNKSARTFSITIVITPEQPKWNTPAGSIGILPASSLVEFQFNASPVLPASTIRYSLLSGNLPPGIELTSSGLLYGRTSVTASEISYSFVIRVTDNLQNIRDRSFSVSISGTAVPTFTNPDGSILTTLDSVWINLPVLYNNPISSNKVSISVNQGILPPGLEINSEGIIRGYPKPPTYSVDLNPITTNITQTSSVNNTLTCFSTLDFIVGRTIVFSSPTLGGIQANKVYYIKSVDSLTTFTISNTENGTTVNLSDDNGFVNATLPAITAGYPVIRTYNFSLELKSDNGNDIANYSITVINQNTPVAQGGPGNPPNTRIPTILNTRPLSYNPSSSDLYYGYYLPVTNPSVPVNIGTFQSGDYLAFKVIGYDFDGNNLKYSYTNVPLGLTADVNTGWISGTPLLNTTSLNKYDFQVRVYKDSIPDITSVTFNYSMQIAKNIIGTVIWNTDNNLGTIYNSVISTLYVLATSDVVLSYRIVDGSLPPNLSLLSNGQITGYVADQPSTSYLTIGETSNYTFTIEAYSEQYPSISSTKVFNLTVIQKFDEPTDILYMKCTPSIQDRNKLESLLSDKLIIPDEVLYRPNDKYFGKATSIIYEHAYGIYANDIDHYLASVTKNHYWRNITLGEIKTAIAKNATGDVIYEVVYSQVIDDLTTATYDVISSEFLIAGRSYTIINPGTTDFTKVGASASESGIVFVATGPALGTGTVSADITVTSINSSIYWPRPILVDGAPITTRELYPNSLPNMRNRVADVLGQDYNSRLLPLWMTSQQENGSTIGFVPAWVICYTKPGYSKIVKNNIVTMWPYELNQINFKLDRFSVDKSNTYNYDNNFNPPSWTNLPSASPTPDPLDSKDFYVLFPRKTILPDT